MAPSSYQVRRPGRPRRGVRYNCGMPIFEYACQECGARFEVLMREGVTPACPKCRSQQVDKQLSAFAVGAASAKAAPMPAAGPCGGCANAGACGMN